MQRTKKQERVAKESTTYEGRIENEEEKGKEEEEEEKEEEKGGAGRFKDLRKKKIGKCKIG